MDIDDDEKSNLESSLQSIKSKLESQLRQPKNEVALSLAHAIMENNETMARDVIRTAGMKHFPSYPMWTKWSLNKVIHSTLLAVRDRIKHTPLWDVPVSVSDFVRDSLLLLAKSDRLAHEGGCKYA